MYKTEFTQARLVETCEPLRNAVFRQMTIKQISYPIYTTGPPEPRRETAFFTLVTAQYQLAGSHSLLINFSER